MPIAVELSSDAFADLGKLASKRLKQEAFALMKRLKSNPMLGQPLGYRPRVGNLSDCRKLYFGRHGDAPPSHRIVYRLVPDEHEPKRAKVIAIGPRGDEQAYHDAVQRLGRL